MDVEVGGEHLTDSCLGQMKRGHLPPPSSRLPDDCIMPLAMSGLRCAAAQPARLSALIISRASSHTAQPAACRPTPIP